MHNAAIATAAVIVNIILNLILVQTPLKEAGLALATSITSVLNILILIMIIRKKISFNYSFLFSGLKTLVATAFMSVVLLLILDVTETAFADGTFGSLLKVCICIVTGILVFSTFGYIFNKHEFKKVIKG